MHTSQKHFVTNLTLSNSASRLYKHRQLEAQKTFHKILKKMQYCINRLQQPKLCQLNRHLRGNERKRYCNKTTSNCYLANMRKQEKKHTLSAFTDKSANAACVRKLQLRGWIKNPDENSVENLAALYHSVLRLVVDPKWKLFPCLIPFVINDHRPEPGALPRRERLFA